MLDKKDKRIKWFDEARFGLFIHWGLYSATEGYWNGKETKGIGEWIQAREQIPNVEYEKLADKMTLDKFDAKKWAELANNAGMKYVVFTAKHHEGFAMYDTKYDDYSIVKRSPYKKDIAGELAEAMRNAGIAPCFYYSQAIDFHEENAMGNTWDYKTPENERDFKAYINCKCKFQLKELLENYGDIRLVWMDVPKGITEEIALDLKALVKSIQPNCLVSGRIGGTEDMGDYGCLGDNQIPTGKLEGCWETASTMNDTWSYKRDDKNFKSPKEIIELLCGLTSKGVNLLLNIGPKPSGEIPQESIGILTEVGKWMSVNSEAIYGTQASPFPTDFSFGWASCKNNVIYLFVNEKSDKIEIKNMKSSIKKVVLLGKGKLNFAQNGNDLYIDLSDVDFDEYVTVIKLEVDTLPEYSEGILQQEKDYIILPACLCIINKNDAAIKEEFSHEEDTSVDAERFNLMSSAEISINKAGILENWFSEKNYISFEFFVEEYGEYEVAIYTLTQKYKPWVGGHRVMVECNNQEISSALGEDIIPNGANRKYFSETGSNIGKLAFSEKGKYELKLYANEINKADEAGLMVSKIILRADK